MFRHRKKGVWYFIYDVNNIKNARKISILSFVRRPGDAGRMIHVEVARDSGYGHRSVAGLPRFRYRKSETAFPVGDSDSARAGESWRPGI
jgi:hypothetical protein